MKKEIHKVAAIVIKNDCIFMVRKKGKDIWTSLGGKPEGNETEQAALLREIKEEVDCDAEIIKKVGDFKGKAAFDNAILKLSVYNVKLNGHPNLIDEELEECGFIPNNYQALGIKLTETFENQVIPELRRLKIINW